MIENTALYPYSAELFPFVKMVIRKNTNYLITELIAPRGFGLDGKDAGYARNREKLNIVVTSDFNENDIKWNQLLVIDIDHETPELVTEKQAYIKRTLLANKRVIYYANVRDDIVSEEFLTQMKEQFGNQFLLYRDTDILSCVYHEHRYKKLEHIETPIILVGGLLREADTFEVLMQLVAKIQENQQKVTAFCAHTAGLAAGYQSILPIFRNDSISESKKIELMNGILKNAEEKEHPDVIIIEAPDAVMSYNAYATNGFGIQTYLLTQAVTPDYFVCCIPCDLARQQILSELGTNLERKLDCKVNVFHASNTQIDYILIRQEKKLTYTFLPLEKMNSILENYKKEEADDEMSVYNTLIDNGERLYQELLGEN